MRIFEIFDEELHLSIGVLLYYDKAHTFIIELQESLDEWTAPLLLTRFIREKSYTIPRDISFLWVKERIIPSTRQNSPFSIPSSSSAVVFSRITRYMF